MKGRIMMVNKEGISRRAKVVTLILASSLALFALTGCTKTSVLDNSELSQTSVITYEDGTKDIVSAIGVCDTSKYSHYESIITGEAISSKDCNDDYHWFHRRSRSILNHRIIINEESIIKYLTPEEVEKAINGKLVDNDIAAIINRVLTQTSEKGAIQR